MACMVVTLTSDLSCVVISHAAHYTAAGCLFCGVKPLLPNVRIRLRCGSPAAPSVRPWMATTAQRRAPASLPAAFLQPEPCLYILC